MKARTTLTLVGTLLIVLAFSTVVLMSHAYACSGNMSKVSDSPEIQSVDEVE